MVTDICTTLMLLLLTVTHRLPSVVIRVISYFTFSYHIKNVPGMEWKVIEMDGKGRRHSTKGW